MSRTTWAFLCIGAVVVIVGCSTPPKPKAVAITDPFEGMCNAVALPAEPDLMAWDAKSRAQLDQLRRQGVVAVRLETRGCEVSLELLPDCIGPKNKYVFSPFKATDTKIARNAKDLLTQLPVGATGLSPQIQANRAVRTDFKVVGSVALPEGTKVTEYDLVGPVCRRATHVISAVYIGGFRMTAGDLLKVGATSTNLFAAPSSEAGESLVNEGYPAVCERAETEGLELGGCSVPLRVTLTPLDGSAPPPRCSQGFFFDGTKCAAEALRNAPLCTTWGAAEDATCISLHTAEAASGDQKQVFDQAAVERIIRQRQGNVRRACWESSAASVKRINVSVVMTIDPKGKVLKVDPQVVDAEGPSDAATSISKCIGNEVLAWQFPEPGVEQALTVPFHLIRQ